MNGPLAQLPHGCSVPAAAAAARGQQLRRVGRQHNTPGAVLLVLSDVRHEAQPLDLCKVLGCDISRESILLRGLYQQICRIALQAQTGQIMRNSVISTQPTRLQPRWAWERPRRTPRYHSSILRNPATKAPTQNVSTWMPCCAAIARVTPTGDASSGISAT